MNDLSPDMQKRLDLWRKNTIPVESVKKVTPQWDYGDDIRDYERKEEALWNKEKELNNRGYL